MQDHVYPFSYRKKAAALPEARQGNAPPRQVLPAECKEKIVAAFIRIRPLPRQVFPVEWEGKIAVAFACIRPLPRQALPARREGKVGGPLVCIRLSPRHVFERCGARRGGVRFQLVSVFPIALGYRLFGLHKMPAAAGNGANDTRRL